MAEGIDRISGQINEEKRFESVRETFIVICAAIPSGGMEIKMITAIMIGAGQRGYEVYGEYGLHHRQKIKFVAVAEPHQARRERFARSHNISEEDCYLGWEEILQKPKMADCAFVCTQDRVHTEPALAALRRGYHVVLEKPMAPTAIECKLLGNFARQQHRILNICHVLRFSDFFTTVKKIIDSDEIGEIINIKHAENVGFWHQAHSFVRGNWSNSEQTTPMVLQKTCHDMDILLWLIGKKCSKVSSFGGLYYFRKEKMPIGATLRCTDSCPHKKTCLYNAERFYLNDNVSWPVSVISEDKSLAARKKALREGPYGRCVYQCDNNVVDHQVTCLEFETGVTATLTMTAFTPDCTRSIEIMGSKGYLRAEMNKFGENSNANEITITNFLSGKKRIVYVNDKGLMTGHEGADVSMTDCFVDQIMGEQFDGRTSAEKSVESHLMALAAERSRIETRTVRMEEMWSE